MYYIQYELLTEHTTCHGTWYYILWVLVHRTLGMLCWRKRVCEHLVRLNEHLVRLKGIYVDGDVELSRLGLRCRKYRVRVKGSLTAKWKLK